jgi:hypothetical protein
MKKRHDDAAVVCVDKELRALNNIAR